LVLWFGLTAACGTNRAVPPTGSGGNQGGGSGGGGGSGTGSGGSEKADSEVPADGNATDDTNPDIRDGQLDCGAIVELPPVVTVVHALLKTPICDPTFTLVEWPDAGAMPANNGNPYECSATGCPGVSPDAGSVSCAFAFPGLADGTVKTYKLAVSKTGFDTTTITVSSGVDGCVPAVPASNTTVNLFPVIFDAGTSAD
jgi:hypothetical protein